MNPSKQIGDYFSRRFPFFTIFSNTSYPELAFLCFCFSPPSIYQLNSFFIPNPLYSVRPLRRMMYSSMAWRISSGLMYSSAV